MLIEDLTDDEKYMRSYYLYLDSSWWETFRQDYACLVPAALFAGMAVIATDELDGSRKLWLSLGCFLGAYIWRNSGQRWTDATASLIKKYDQHFESIDDDSSES